MKKTDQPIIITKTYNASRETVWRALTELGQMTQWYFEQIPAFRAEVGFETQFAVQVEDRVFTHLWRMTEVIPFQKFTHTWRYLEYPGDAFVTFELAEVEGKTQLTLTLEVIENFAEGIPEFRRESCVGGWEYFLGERLMGYLGE